MMDRGVQSLQQFTSFFLFFELMESCYVCKMQHLALLIIERDIDSLDKKDLILSLNLV